MKSLTLPHLYAILDADLLAARALDLAAFASDLLSAGVTLFQYRNKTGNDRTILNDIDRLEHLRLFSRPSVRVPQVREPGSPSSDLRSVGREANLGCFPRPNKAQMNREKRGASGAPEDGGPSAPGVGDSIKLILNDRADLALLSDCQGVHVGQDDLLPEDARSIVGPKCWVGVSTHTPAQVAEADRTSCDYIAYGPVFPTATKANPDPTVGLDGLKLARSLTRKPLVAIGGMTRRNCRAVLDAGADSVAVISDLLPGAGEPAHRLAEEFLALLA